MALVTVRLLVALDVRSPLHCAPVVLVTASAITVLAALGPVPYRLVRMTWLTPWPLFVPATEALPPEHPALGTAAGGAALLGAVLTIGLIRPWGERFPRWVPVVAGRPVPIAVAAVPGGLVAAVVTSAALPDDHAAQCRPDRGRARWDVRLRSGCSPSCCSPCWIWGPLLGLAVWGYVGHRRGCGSLSAPVTAAPAR